MAPPRDTDAETWRKVVESWRSMTPAERAQAADRMSADVTQLSIAGIRFERPDATDDEIRHELARRRYGSELADAVYGSVDR